MARQSVQQATCTNCNEQAYEVDDRELTSDGVEYDVSCDECGARDEITVGCDGTSCSSGISYGDASWNEDNESDENES